MAKTKKRYGFLVLAAYIPVILSICTIIGCSSKKDVNAEKSSPPKTEINIPSADANKEPKIPALPIPPLPDANKAADVNQAVDVNQRTITPKAAVKPNESSEVKLSPAAILNKFNKAGSSERKTELLGSLSDMAMDQDPRVIKVVQAAVADKDANVALAAVELLQGYETPDILPAVTQAMTHPNEDVRQTALSLLLDIEDPRISKVLSDAVLDESENIRSTALDEIKYKEKDIQFKVLETAISSPYNDTKEEAVFMLQYTGGPQAVDILIEGLRDQNADFREEASSAISTLVDKEFTSYQEAKSWWKKNKSKYDEDLVLIEEK